MSTNDEYTNMDLDTADEMLVAAGHPAIAKALRFQTQGNRNLIQGEWGSRVVSAFENILQAQVVNVLTNVQLRLDEQIALAQQILTTAKEAQKTARQALSVSKAGAARLGKLETRMDASEADRIDLRARLERIERIMADRPEQREAEHQALLDAIRSGGRDG